MAFDDEALAGGTTANKTPNHAPARTGSAGGSSGSGGSLSGNGSLGSGSSDHGARTKKFEKKAAARGPSAQLHLTQPRPVNRHDGLLQPRPHIKPRDARKQTRPISSSLGDGSRRSAVRTTASRRPHSAHSEGSKRLTPNAKLERDARRGRHTTLARRDQPGDSRLQRGRKSENTGARQLSSVIPGEPAGHPAHTGKRRSAAARPVFVTAKKAPARQRIISKPGVHAIGTFEGWVPHPYNDDHNNATIGYGHLLHMGPVTAADVKRWGTISRGKGERLLVADLSTAIAAVKRLVKVPVTQAQFDALVSFTFNEGAGGLAESTALKDLNARRYAKVGADFLHFDRGDPGLQNRHRAEEAMFNHGKYPG